MSEFEALGFNPAPGDAGRVGELAERYGRISTKLGSAAETLDAVASRTGLWEGMAAEAFLSDVHRLPEYLGLAVDSTSRASSALADWASELAGMRRRADILELEARKARAEAEAAGNDPALGLAWREFFDPESLGAAQRLLDAAQARLRAAVDELHAIQEAAERLRDEHTEVAERTAERLTQARELAPDQPRGGLGGLVDDVRDSVGGVVEDVNGFVRDNANMIAAGSRIVSDISFVMSLAADTEIPVFSQAMGAASIGMDVVALGALGVADLGGASVPGREYAEGIAGLAADGVGLIEGVPSTAVEAIEGAATGYDLTQRFEYFEPRNNRQAVMEMLPFTFGTGTAAVGAENMVRGWGEQIHDAREADQAAREERSS